MKKIGMIVAMFVMLQGVSFADIYTEPSELVRGVFFPWFTVIYIDTFTQDYVIAPGAIVEFGPPSSGVYLGHLLGPVSGLYALGILWPASTTEDAYLDIKVYGGEGVGKIGGVGFSLPVRTFWLGGEK